MKSLPRPYNGLRAATALLGAAMLSACWFGETPASLNKSIENGDIAEALSTIEEHLADNPTDPTYNLLAVKARLALCQQRNCITETPGITPPLLTGLPKLTANIAGPVTLAKDTSPLTITSVFDSAMATYATMPQQPEAVLTLYRSVPSALQPRLASGLFQPALTYARRGDYTNAALTLEGITKAENLPTTYGYAAHMLGGMLGKDSPNKTANLIALRSVTTPPLPANAAALLPWALLAEGTTSSTTPATVLSSLPQRLAALQLPNLLTPAAMGAVAGELVTTASSPALTQWEGGWSGTPKTLSLAMQRTALSLDPNQPALWATYLPALVSTTLSQPSGSLVGLADSSSALASPLGIPTITLTSETAPRIGAQILTATARLTDYPGVATPLVTFASRLPLAKQQQVELEKLSQNLLIRAASLGDVTSTVILAQTLPGVAQNNRQSVVPLLVKYIRQNLRDGDFKAATGISDLLTNTLKMDIEFAPLVLEEFTEDLKRRNIPAELAATTPEILLQPAEDVALDLGPLFTFMQSYFENQPKVITAQLTTLIAEAKGTYGQPTAMYRLGSNFPESTLSLDKQREWLAASLEQSLLTDTTLTPVTLTTTAAELAVVHPALNLAPLLEAAVRRAKTLEEQRALWESASPQVQNVLSAIRPEFTLLMQGIDAISAGRLNIAAQSFAGLTDPQWRTIAKPFIEQFNERLVALSGVYVPVSAAPALKTAALILAPQGLTGGKLNTISVTFISRVGTSLENEPVALRTNAAAVHSFTLPTLYNFDTRSLTVTPQAVAQAPNGGTFTTTYGAIRTLKLQSGDAETPVLTVTQADGTATPFIRTLIDPTQPLRPDGTYLLQARLGQQPSNTAAILPPGSMLELTTGQDGQPNPPESDLSRTTVYPLTGTLRHPASNQPLNFTGYYEPETLTSTFTITYPLPVSAQPARAAVRCQALAGPITCGAHNLNSARQAYAALVTGLQTRESLATSAAVRAQLNSTASGRLLEDAVPVIPSPTLTVSSTGGLMTISASTVSGTSALVSSSLATSPSIPTAPASPTQAVSAVQPPLAEPTLEEDEDASLDTPPSPTQPRRNRFATETEPGAFVNNSGAKGTSPTTPETTDPDAPAPGTFINNSGAPKNASPTTPLTPDS